MATVLADFIPLQPPTPPPKTTKACGGSGGIVTKYLTSALDGDV